MLRSKDYDLAVKLGVLDQDTRTKIEYAVDDSVPCDYATEELHSEIRVLKDTIVQLTKELLGKSEEIKMFKRRIDGLTSENHRLQHFIEEYRGDRNLLEEVVDKLEKRK